jgi:hypothetical protein
MEELNAKQVNDLLEWFKENNPYVQVRQSKLLKHLFVILAEEDDKYIEYDLDDCNFYYSPKNFVKKNSKPVTNGLVVSLCLKEFQHTFQLSKQMVLAKNIKDITNIRKINIMKPIEKIIDAMAEVDFVYQLRYDETTKGLFFMISLPYEAEEWFEIYIPDDSMCCFISDAIEEFYDDYDIDYETSRWIGDDGHGKDDAPYHIKDILTHFEKVADKLHEISCKVQKVDEDEDEDDNDICYEWCPECEYEVKLKNEFKLQKCPKCRKLILPCSICPTNYEGCNECVLSKACDFLENPDSEPNIEEYNEMYCCDDRENIPQHILIAFDYIAENGIK